MIISTYHGCRYNHGIYLSDNHVSVAITIPLDERIQDAEFWNVIAWKYNAF